MGFTAETAHGVSLGLGADHPPDEETDARPKWHEANAD